MSIGSANPTRWLSSMMSVIRTSFGVAVPCVSMITVEELAEFARPSRTNLCHRTSERSSKILDILNEFLILVQSEFDR